MRAFAETELNSFDGFISISGSAENTTLRNTSVDFITVAQAFHWFDRQKFKIKCNRILASGGKVILVWNSRDEESELVQENDTIIRKYCPNFKGFSGGMRGEKSDGGLKDYFEGNYDNQDF